MPLDRKQKIIIGSIVIVVLIATLFGFLFRRPLSDLFKKAGSPRESVAESQLQQQVTDLINRGNFDDCSQMQNSYYETVCTNNIALRLAKEKQDISFCQKLDNTLIAVADCEGQVLDQKSVSNENVALCNETANLIVQAQCKSGYFVALALKKGDSKICLQAGDAQSIGTCSDMYLFEKEFITASATFDCKKFEDPGMQHDCTAYQNSFKRSDATCAGITNPLLLNFCISRR